MANYERAWRGEWFDVWLRLIGASPSAEAISGTTEVVI